MSVQENFESVKKALGERSDQVRVMAVSKMQSIDTLREAVQAGIQLFGVNYLQEGDAQREALALEKIEWHFIGHIQSRKAKALPSYDAVQSLDRVEVGEILNRRCEELGKVMPVLVEINIGSEENKSGIFPAQLGDFLASLKTLKALSPRGIMVMPPPLEDLQARRPFFKSAKRLFDKFKGDFPFDTLSMGTSEDYLIAAEEGATLIRLGTSLLGRRPPRS